MRPSRQRAGLKTDSSWIDFSAVSAVSAVNVMLISLFITCYNDTLFPETGKAVVAVLERLGHQVEFRREQTCCGQMHYNTGYVREARPLMEHLLDVFEGAEVICIPSASCVAMIREHYPKMAAASGDQSLVQRVDGLLGRVFEFTELLVEKLGVTDVGASFPHTVTLHPSCHALRSLRLGDKPQRLLRAVRGLELVDLPGSDECCGFGGTFSLKNADVSSAMVSDKARAVLETQCRGLHRRRQLLPDAHRRRAQPAWLRRPLPPHRGASRRHRRGRARPMIRVGDAAVAPDFPAAARDALANVQLRRNVRHATTVIRDKRASVVGEMADWEELREAAHHIKDHVLRYLDFYLEQFEERCTRAGGQVHWARDADEANRVIVEIIRAHGQSEIIKVKTMTSDETRLNVALEAAGITPYETDLADLIVQLGADRPSHIVVPALHRNRTEIRDIFRRTMHLEQLTDRAVRSGGRRAAVPAREVPPRPGRVQRRQLRDRRYRVGVRRGVGRQRTHVRHAAAAAGHAGRHRKGGAGLSRSRGLSATAPAVRDRRADEPVQLDLDRRHRR